MEVLTKTCKSGNVYKFVNEYWETSYAWGHKTTIIRNGYDYDAHKVRYYNRTWECYTYQSCMSGAVEEIRDLDMNRYIMNYKYEHNYERFKKGEKQKVIDMWKQTDFAKDCVELKEAIRDRKFD